MKVKTEFKWHMHFMVSNYHQGSARVCICTIFNTFLCDLFQVFLVLGIANYVDDNTPYSTKKLNKVLQDLAKELNTLFK